MFKRLTPPTRGTVMVTIDIEGETVSVPAADSVAAAVLAHGLLPTRTTPVSGRPRAPLCMMGVCFDCLMEIDGQPNRQACMVQVAEGMRIRRQAGSGRSGAGPIDNETGSESGTEARIESGSKTDSDQNDSDPRDAVA